MANRSLIDNYIHTTQHFSRGEEVRVALQMRAAYAAGDTKTANKLRNSLVWQNQKGINMLVRRWHNEYLSGLDWEDFQAACMLQIVRFAEKFDPNRGVRFMRFAELHIRAVLFMDAQKRGGLKMITTARHRRISQLWARVAESLPRGYTTAEFENYMVSLVPDATVQDVRVVEAYRAGIRSLDATARPGDGAPPLMETVVSPTPGPDRQVVDKRKLLRRQRAVTKYIRTFLALQPESTRPRYEAIINERVLKDKGDRLTLVDIGKSFGVTRERIRQQEAKFYTWMRTNIPREELEALL